MTMRVLLTGASGFIGRRLLSRLHAEGATCTVLSRRESCDFPAEVAVVPADCRNAEQVHDAMEQSRPELVFHCAMTSGHPRSPAERMEMLATSVIGTANLLEASAAFGVQRFVHACSGLVYAPQSRPLVENDVMAPATMRGVAKASASLLVQLYGNTTPLHTVGLRIFSVYGPGESSSRFIPTVLRCARDATPLSLIPWPRHDFVFVDDVVDALMTASVADIPTGSMFNIAGGRTWSNTEVVSLAESVTGRAITLAQATYPASPADTPVWHGDIAAAGRLLGWSPATPFPVGLRSSYVALCRT